MTKIQASFISIMTLPFSSNVLTSPLKCARSNRGRGGLVPPTAVQIAFNSPTQVYVLAIARLSLLTLLWFPSAAAQQYRFDSWTMDNGLPQNSISAIIQTHDGYLWIATFDGLLRFDGVQFKVFDKITPKDSAPTVLLLFTKTGTGLSGWERMMAA